MGELVVGVLFVGVGVACCYAVLFIVRAVRRAIVHLDDRVGVVDPKGGTWSVRVSVLPEPMRFFASRRTFGMTDGHRERRKRSGMSEDGVEESELANPSHVIGWSDEGVGCVGPILLTVFLLALAVFLIEILLIALLVVVVSIGLSFVRRWQCEVVDPDGTRHFVHAGSLRDARRVRDETVHHIEAGIWSPQ